jgi:uncharacterized delta-60 repeat protein
MKRSFIRAVTLSAFLVVLSSWHRAHVLLAVVLVALLFLSPSISRVRAGAGDLDPTFGNGGLAFADFNGREAEAFASALQADGKVVMAGSVFATSFNLDFALARFTTQGTLDPGFGTGGKTTTEFFGRNDRVLALAIQSDGKIIAAGFANDPFTGTDSFALARYNIDGSLDNAFGVNGKVITVFGDFSRALAISLQTDGRIVVAGIANALFGVARYNADGTLDSTFGFGGEASSDFFSGFRNIFAIAFQPDGKILAVGFVASASFLPADFALARYNADGSKDASFGAGGEVRTDFGSSDSAYAVAVQADGRIIAAGEAGLDFGLARYNPDGTPDNSFGTGGKLTTAFFGGAVDGEGRVTAVVIQPSGKILAGGHILSGSHLGFGLVRYTASGGIDGSFGSNGRVVTDLNTSFGPVALLLQADGKIVAPGCVFQSSTLDFVVARYIGETFDFCIQDDSNGNLLQFNSTTGNYQFTNCSGFTLSGTGTLIKRGGIITLQHYAIDRRVLARIDGGANKGTATIQVLSLGTTFTITDRNTANNTCACTAH